MLYYTIINCVISTQIRMAAWVVCTDQYLSAGAGYMTLHSTSPGDVTWPGHIHNSLLSQELIKQFTNMDK